MQALTRLEEELLREHFPKASDFRAAASRMLDLHEPLAYIIGEWYFYGETYRLNRDCLIPRPETEHVVDELIRRLPQNGVFADLCTGSGCIAVSALVHRKDASCLAVDISEGALSMARENAERNGVGDRITLKKADILRDPPKTVLDGRRFDIIVSNPPYINSSVIETLSDEVRQEPRLALDGGEDGMNFYRVLLDGYLSCLNKGGLLILEIGYDQAERIRALHPCDILKDYSGNDRVAVIQADG